MTERPYIYGTAALGGNGSHATVVNGSANVVGISTAWTSIAFGDYFALGGSMVPILAIVDDTHLTLAMPWPGASVSGGSYAITAGIADTDARRYGWTVQSYYQRLANIPTDTQTFRDQAAASATAAAGSATGAAGSATLASAWASTAYNTDVPGATAGSRSALHWSTVAQNYATLASSNGAAQVTLATAQVTLAAGWASTAVDTDVPGAAPGSRSALHYSAKALATYNLALTALNDTNAAKATTQGYVATAAANVLLAADWAQKGIGLDVNGVGTRSAYHWSTIANAASTSASGFATNAAASASAAALSAALLANPDFGFITDAPTDFQDWGSVP